MAKKKRARKKTRRRTAGRRKADKFPGWIGMVMGLVVGLVVAFFVYISDLKPPEQLKSAAARQTQAAVEAVEKAGETVEAAIEEIEEPKITFDFYEMLPDLSVEVFEDEPRPTARKAEPKKVTTPGIYILQAGSFTSIDDANRRKAEVALLGIRSEIKRGKANKRDVYRIYTEPMEKPDDVNRVSGQLNDAGIDILLKRVSD
ncbi:MAG: SPOR domain-containing protein [Gammaproteobacteria bacterium]